MSIEKIEIRNFKSIKYCAINLSEINLLIGENGCGKTNVLNAIKFFMQNLDSDDEINECGQIFDINNPYCNCFKITIFFNLKKFKKIASDRLIKISLGLDYNFKSYYKQIFKLASKGELLKVTLVKIKNKEIKWNLKPEERKILCSLFPIYFIDSRQIDLFDWSSLWLSIGDLIKLNNESCEDIKVTINKYIDEYKDQKFTYALTRLNHLINNSFIQLSPYTQKEYSSSLLKTYFKGDQFIYSSKKLSYFSNGTNAFNYTIFLIDVLLLISNSKLKEPIILLDEPELSLHHFLIDKLTSKILNCQSNIRIVVSTHSARIVKNILQDDNNNKKIYNIKMDKEYSAIVSMKLFNKNEYRERNFMIDDHANAYFSKIILCVEGESDVSFLNNRYLKAICPVLDVIDIYRVAANNVLLNIVHPQMRNYNAPYIILFDMDKALVFDLSKSTLKLTNLFRFSNKYYQYHPSYKSANQFLLYRRIRGIADKIKVTYDKTWGSCNDAYFHNLINLIKEYFLYHSTFINETTIEGLIVNKVNYDLFKDYFTKDLNNNDRTDFNNLFNTFSKPREKCNLLRLFCDGKTDIILNSNQLTSLSPPNKALIDRLKKSKTQGWVDEFIEFFFLIKVREKGHKCKSYKEFMSVINMNPEILTFLRSEFVISFKELSSLISFIEAKYKD